ncbi:MAG: PTS lactose/cellobiose transporter subunit IIA [Clostridia bacterium]
MDEQMEMICFQMITFAGEAKSCYMEALQAVKEKDFDKADGLIEDAAKNFSEVHKAHADLIQKECDGQKVEMSLLMTHVEDQMMSVETIKIMVFEFYELYKMLYKIMEDK